MHRSLAAAATGVFIACKGLLDPIGPINQGAVRPVQISAPNVASLNAQLPAASQKIRRRVTSVTVGALAQAVSPYLVGDGKEAVAPRKGYVVAEFPPEFIIDNYAVREVLEGLAARRVRLKVLSGAGAG